VAADELNERAVRAAVDLAAEAGLDVGAPAILSDKSNLIVHLAPTPVVARVATTTGAVRQGRAWLEREAAVAGYLASVGAPVVPPSSALAPGTHERGGLVMTFWEHIEERATADDLDPARAGRALHDCHEALEGFPGELPPLQTLREAEDNLERIIDAGTLDAEGGDILRAVAAEVIDRVERLDLPLRPVHGDAHLGNVISGPDGPLWNDWEDAHLSPLAWDLACLHFSQRGGSADAAQAAFADMPVDEATLELFLEARRLQVTVWAAVVAPDQPFARDALATQLARYREQTG
jgi:aminoglycoside phosphotransferase (APT) family kinase protein